MDLAPFPRGNVRAVWPRVRAFVAAWLAMASGACVALPEVQPKSASERTILIKKSEVKPLLYSPALFDLREPGATFDISSAIEPTPADLKVEIFWYYDYDPDLGLLVQHWQICGGGGSCFLTICNKPEAKAARHHLWAVVSDGKRRANTTKPFEFEDGVVFDAVIWEIETENACLTPN